MVFINSSITFNLNMIKYKIESKTKVISLYLAFKVDAPQKKINLVILEIKQMNY